MFSFVGLDFQMFPAVHTDMNGISEAQQTFSSLAIDLTPWICTVAFPAKSWKEEHV